MTNDKPVAEVRAEVVKGLKVVGSLAPSHGYAELTGGVRASWADPSPSPYVRGEVGWKLRSGMSAFAFGEADRLGYMAGVGFRVEW